MQAPSSKTGGLLLLLLLLYDYYYYYYCYYKGFRHREGTFNPLSKIKDHSYMLAGTDFVPLGPYTTLFFQGTMVRVKSTRKNKPKFAWLKFEEQQYALRRLLVQRALREFRRRCFSSGVSSGGSFRVTPRVSNQCRGLASLPSVL